MPRCGMADARATAVRAYYDRGTWSFLALGQGGREGVIHRAVWGPGVTARADAFHYVHDRIAHHLRETGTTSPHVLDLGCGVGATLLRLADTVPGLRGTGLTISPRQVHAARARVAEAGAADRVTVREGDFCALPTDLPQVDAAVAIESFVHAPDPAVFFSGCARVLRPGGRLWLCDDLRAEVVPRDAHSTLARFQRGWHAPSLLARTQVEALADAAGFTCESAECLTPWLELGRPRDRLAAVVAPLLARLPVAQAQMLAGGSALQTALRRGWIDYLLLTFCRR